MIRLFCLRESSNLYQFALYVSQFTTTVNKNNQSFFNQFSCISTPPNDELLYVTQQIYFQATISNCLINFIRGKISHTNKILLNYIKNEINYNSKNILSINNYSSLETFQNMCELLLQQTQKQRITRQQFLKSTKNDSKVRNSVSNYYILLFNGIKLFFNSNFMSSNLHLKNGFFLMMIKYCFIFFFFFSF